MFAETLQKSAATKWSEVLKWDYVRARALAMTIAFLFSAFGALALVSLTGELDLMNIYFFYHIFRWVRPSWHKRVTVNAAVDSILTWGTNYYLLCFFSSLWCQGKAPLRSASQRVIPSFASQGTKRSRLSFEKYDWYKYQSYFSKSCHVMTMSCLGHVKSTKTLEYDKIDDKQADIRAWKYKVFY